MYDNDRRLDALIVRRRGLLVRDEAIAAGVAPWLIDDRIRGGVLVILFDGIYRHAAAPFTQDTRWLAAVLACGPDAVLSGRAAAALWGFPGVRRVRPEVTTPHTDLPRAQGFDRHRAVRLRPFERAEVRGIPVTSKGKTALDLCWHTSFGFAQEVISAAVITKVLSPLDIVLTLERSCGRGIRGTTNLRRIGRSLEELDGLESVLELHGSREIELARVPTPVKQFEMTCADGRRVRLDVAWPDLRVGLDWDGKRWHGTPARKKRTAERHASIESSGWRHLQYGHVDVHETPNEMRAQVELEVNRRRQRPAA